MQKFVIALGAILMGYAASAGADALGAGPLLSYAVGGVGSIAGIVLGWKLSRLMA